MNKSDIEFLMRLTLDVGKDICDYMSIKGPREKREVFFNKMENKYNPRVQEYINQCQQEAPCWVCHILRKR